MASIKSVEKGIANYLDKELLPQLPQTGWEKVVTGTAIALFIRKLGSVLAYISTNKMIQVMDIVSESGDVDISLIREELVKQIPPEGFTVDVPVLGPLRFKKEDADKLYSYIMEVGD